MKLLRSRKRLNWETNRSLSLNRKNIWKRRKRLKKVRKLRLRKIENRESNRKYLPRRRLSRTKALKNKLLFNKRRKLKKKIDIKLR